MKLRAHQLAIGNLSFFVLLALVYRAFKFPMDMYLEPEFWAETGQIDPKEQHEINVVRNSLFTIEPKSGSLGPGEKVVVRCAYLHTSLGTSSLPVLLKINRGREVMVRGLVLRQ